MAGALMQLVAYGAQDVYLTGNPQITFFKVVYRRHTNFAMESMEQSLTGNAAYGNKVTCRVARNGDLLGATYLETTFNNNGNGVLTYVPRTGFALIKNAELRIGGQKIDRQSGVWMDVWTELTSSFDHYKTLDGLVGCRSQGATVGGNDQVAGLEGEADANGAVVCKAHVPLQFSFCRNPGLALPLIALQYHEVELIIEFNRATDVTNRTDSTISNTALWCDYIFLDTEERKNFAQNPHEYLIETVQENVNTLQAGTTANPVTDSLKLTFNHPVKELVWVSGDNTTLGSYETDGGVGAQNQTTNPCLNATLKLNGQDRFAQRNGSYFNDVQSYQHHTGNPGNGINCYSFALKPEEHQPSGTCNFSRVDNAELVVTPANNNINNITVFAHGYNVLRVASGMGGLAYSN